MPKPEPPDVDEAYREWIRNRGCLVRGCRYAHARVQAHHVRSKGARGGDHGNLCPLCMEHHTEGETGGWITFQRKYSLNLRLAAEVLYQLYRAWCAVHGVDVGMGAGGDG